jgi:acyl-CoA thioester hydrolase
MHEALKDFPVVLSFPIHWGDMDSFAHVNNIVYLRWCETTRVEYLTRLGLWQRKAVDGIGPILASITCDFRRALAHPDTVHVGARITEVGNSSFKMAHRIVSESLGEVAADVESTVVLIDYSRGKSVPLPSDIRAAIERFERG